MLRTSVLTAAAAICMMVAMAAPAVHAQQRTPEGKTCKTKTCALKSTHAQCMACAAKNGWTGPQQAAWCTRWMAECR